MCYFADRELEKRDCVLRRLETLLKLELSTTERLDVLVALKEANALEPLRRHTTILDFSKSLLTVASLNILCSVLKHLENVTHLSMSDCGLDDELLEEFATSTKGFGIKVRCCLLFPLAVHNFNLQDAFLQMWFHASRL